MEGTAKHIQNFYKDELHEDSAANVIRFAKAVHEEAPNVLTGVGALSAVHLPQAESGLHEVIESWNMTLPLEIYYWQRGFIHCPMLRVNTWFEYLLVRHPGVLLGGFPLEHGALPMFLKAFWEGFRYDEPSHLVYERHPDSLDCCIPVSFYSDEGRGVRKSPVLVVGLEVVFGYSSFADFQKNARKKPWSCETMWSIQHDTNSGSSLLSRLLLYVLPNKVYKGKRNNLWHDVCSQVGRDLASAFNEGICVNGRQYYLVLVGCKGDAPALNKVGRMTRTFQHLSGPGGMCCHCLAGQEAYPWEDMRESAAWRATIHKERPWSATCPSNLACVPYSNEAPERMFRSDPLHLVKLGVARHFVGSAIVVLGEWGIYTNSGNSVDQLLMASETDFMWSARTELKQTPHLKSLTRDLLHWPRRQVFPWGGFLARIQLYVFLIL